MARAKQLLLLTVPTLLADGFLLREASKANRSLRETEAEFGEFMQLHGRPYQPGSDEYTERLALFAVRVAEVEAHNDAGRSWRAAVNMLADRTPEELAQLRGYRHLATDDGGGAGSTRGSVGFIGTGARTTDLKRLPREWTWRGILQAMADVQDQRSCGSCWAVATSTVLQAHSELYQRDRTFSIQQIIDCVPNPMSCGGTGGCSGATAELAMDYVAKVGLVTAEAREYEAADNACPAEMKPPKPSLRSALKQVVSLPDVTIADGGGAAFGMHGWRKLPSNEVVSLIEAVYENGPVAVSVSATSVWNSYSSGVVAACDQDAIVNHAVVLTGYGEQEYIQDGLVKYWQIQNSWGSGWGEGGFARLLRLDTKDEGAFCGWDISPGDGTGCSGGPDKVWVCGSCGILYDSVVPKFTLSADGWLARNPRN